MTIFILLMITLVPFALTFIAYSLTNGIVFNENYASCENAAQDIITLNTVTNLCFEGIA